MMTPPLRTADHSWHPFLFPVMAVLLILSWSSGFIGTRYASAQTGVAVMLFWRTLLSGVILLPFALAIGPRIRARPVLSQMGFGTLAMFIYLGGFALAIGQHVPTGLVALIADLLPLAIAMLSQPVLGERLTRKQWIGTVLAVVGVLIVSANSLSVGFAPLWAYGVTIGSMLVFAFASVLFKGQPALNMPIHQSLCIHSLTSAVLFGIIGLTQGSLLPPLNLAFAIGMLWLVPIGTFASYSVYYAMLRMFPVTRVSAAIYLSPPVTMIWAWMLFAEPLTPIMFLGLAVTLLGVWQTSRIRER